MQFSIFIFRLYDHFNAVITLHNAIPLIFINTYNLYLYVEVFMYFLIMIVI